MSSTEASTPNARDLLLAWLRRQLPSAAAAWLMDRLDRVRGGTERDLYLAISLVPRNIGKDDLTLDAGDLAAAKRCRPDWMPAGWSVDQAARLVLLLSTNDSGELFAHRLERLFVTADVRELITFYRGLPLYPGQPRFIGRALEGVRTNMKSVFEAVAHHNPYPAEQFSEAAWNQMVVKALFIGSTVAPIQQLERRLNADLARMLRDYARERRAAGRSVSPELWRLLGTGDA